MTGPEILRPDGWPRPVGYSDGIAVPAGRLIFLAGQVGWNPRTQQFETDDMAAQVRQALSNVVAALAAGGARPDQIVRLNWYVTDRQAYLDARPAIGLAWREILGRHYPPMTLLVVAGLAEARSLVEIEVTAVVSE